MSWLSLLLPVEQGAACLAALRRHADSHCGVDHEARTRDQVMADTAVERLTGQAHAEDVNVEVNLVIPLDALTPNQPDTEQPTDEPGTHTAAPPDRPAPGPPEPDSAEPDSTEPDSTEPDSTGPDSTGPDSTEPDSAGPDSAEPDSAGPDSAEPDSAGPGGGVAELVGYGPIPMGIARDILASTAGRRWWRRLFAAPTGGAHLGPLVGGDPRRRRFDGFLAHLLGIRDHGRCRDPYCDAPIRHRDHIRQARAGGPATYTNGRGVCARGNYVREMPDWHLKTLHDGLHGVPHTVQTTTPTGHTYTSRAGPAP